MTEQNRGVGCHGNGPQHCCYVPGSGIPDPRGTGQDVCPFLEVDTIPGRHWVCGAKRKLGTWENVHANPAYQEQVYQRVFKPRGIALCGDWRVEGQCCFGPDNSPIYNVT